MPALAVAEALRQRGAQV
ncbi:MAG: hypothetical protein WAU69_15325, partial [Solirubrobacteraceae bacterium]